MASRTKPLSVAEDRDNDENEEADAEVDESEDDDTQSEPVPEDELQNNEDESQKTTDNATTGTGTIEQKVTTPNSKGRTKSKPALTLATCPRAPRMDAIRVLLLTGILLMGSTAGFTFLSLQSTAIHDAVANQTWILILAAVLGLVLAISYMKCHYERKSRASQIMALVFSYVVILFGLILVSLFLKTSTAIVAMLCSCALLLTLFLFSLQPWLELRKVPAIIYCVVAGIVALVLAIYLPDRYYWEHIDGSNFYIMPPAGMFGRVLIVFFADSYTILFLCNMFSLFEKCTMKHRWFMSCRLHTTMGYVMVFAGFAASNDPGMPDHKVDVALNR